MRRIDPVLAEGIMMKGGFTPLIPYPGAGEKWSCKCNKCGFESEPRLVSVRKGHGCKKCAGFWVDSTDARNLMLKNDFTPLEEYPGSDKPWKMKHNVCGNIGNHTYIQIKNAQGGGCLECGHKRGTKLRSVSEEVVLEELQKKNLILLGSYISGKINMSLKCSICGYEFESKYSTIRRINGCKNCSNRIVTDEKIMKVLMLANVEALEPFSHSQNKWKCKCLGCGDIVFPRYANMQRGTGACKNCSESGYNHKKPSFLYFMKNEEFGAFKVGIGNEVKKKSNNRVYRLQKSGWVLIKIWKRNEGKSCEQVEVNTLNWVRKELKMPQFMNKQSMPFSGETETFSADLVSEMEIITKIEGFFSGFDSSH